jgi:hypothetical protein
VDEWRSESSRSDCFLDPDNHIVAGAALVVSQVMIQTDLDHLTKLKKLNRFAWPKNSNPAFRRAPLVIQCGVSQVS